jgi:hypothetical protein
LVRSHHILNNGIRIQVLPKKTAFCRSSADARNKAREFSWSADQSFFEPNFPANIEKYFNIEACFIEPPQ